jgi:RNA 2',3'-cyclic 3'-phosphodiesterase
MTGNNPLRLFIAIAIPEGVKAKIEGAQAELRRALPDCNARWTRPEQFHLTLKFLGDVEESRVDALGESIRAACPGFTPLHLRAEGVGCFPDLRRPRVLWTGVRDEAGQLLRLQEAVALATHDFTSEQKEERFTGHVTLARFKGIRPTEAKVLGSAVPAMANRLFGEWTAHRIELMRSELLPQGARHLTLAAIALGGPPADLA